MDNLTIPEIRLEFEQLAKDLRDGVDVLTCATRLEELSAMTKRKSSIRKRAPVKWPKLTPEKAIEIRAYADAFPELNFSEIANALGCNQGRVSEAVNGFRDGKML